MLLGPATASPAIVGRAWSPNPSVCSPRFWFWFRLSPFALPQSPREAPTRLSSHSHAWPAPRCPHVRVFYSLIPLSAVRPRAGSHLQTPQMKLKLKVETLCLAHTHTQPQSHTLLVLILMLEVTAIREWRLRDGSRTQIQYTNMPHPVYTTTHCNSVAKTLAGAKMVWFLSRRISIYADTS